MTPRVKPVMSPSTAQLFAMLVATWKADTIFTSSTTAMSNHPAYRQIIDLGAPAVPLLLALLPDTPDHWFVALAEITGADPVPEHERGDVKKMAASWLSWGRAHILIS